MPHCYRETFIINGDSFGLDPELVANRTRMEVEELNDELIDDGFIPELMHIDVFPGGRSIGLFFKESL